MTAPVHAGQVAAAFLETLGKSLQAFPCPDCGETYQGFEGSGGGPCDRCLERSRIDREIAPILASFEAHVLGFMKRAGLSSRELTARRAQIPPGLAKILFRDETEVSRRVRAMLDPAGRLEGFGLTGDTGTGKSYALGSLFMAAAHARLRPALEAQGKRALADVWLTWAKWPEIVTRFRGIAGDEGGLRRVEAEMVRLGASKCLVLDDLGAERFVGASYAEDWMASQLDLLVDRRYNEQKPTWFTTNLGPREFIARYGARLFSRLASENILVRVPTIGDLRLARDRPG